MTAPVTAFGTVTHRRRMTGSRVSSLNHGGRCYDQLVNVSSTQMPGVPRVQPGNADGSYLVHKVDGRAGIIGRRMPLAGPPYLTDGQILILRRWIELGAPRN